MSTRKGYAAVTGVDGITFTAGIVSGTHAAKNQSAEHTRDSSRAYLRDGAGDTAGVYFHDAKQVINITVIPGHGSPPTTPGTIADARTSLSAWRVAPGTLVTIADGDGTIIDGDYNLLSSKERRTNTDYVMLDLELEKFDANNATAPTS